MSSKSSSGGSADSPLQWASASNGSDGKFETVGGVTRTKWNDYSSYSWRAVRTVGKRNAFGTSIDVWTNSTCFPGPLLKANDLITLQSRLSEAVKGHQFNLAVSAAQGKQTVDMVSNAIFSVGGAISDLKKGRFESAARRFGVNPRPSKLSEKDISGRWLELQYGWLPMLSDIYEASKAYESISNGPRKSRIQVNINRKQQGDASCASSIYTCKGMNTDSARIIYEMSEQISTPRSLGLTDPLSVAWELIPYSFVVDWFIPIGDYLENLNVIPNLQGRFLTTRVQRFQGSTIWVDGSYRWFSKPIEHVQYFNMTRTVSTSLTVAKPGFNSIPDAMSPKRIFNALALVVQRIR